MPHLVAGQDAEERPRRALDHAFDLAAPDLQLRDPRERPQLVHGRRSVFEEELASQRSKHDKLAAAVPWLAGLTSGVAERLEAAAAASAADPLTTSHGSFRTAQVVLLDGRVGIIDVDKLCQAEPAADIGPFLAKLRHTAVNKTGVNKTGVNQTAANQTAVSAAAPLRVQEQVDRLHDAFLGAYRAAAPVTLERVGVWEALEHFSLVLGSAKKGLAERASSCAAMMHRHLDRHGI